MAADHAATVAPVALVTGGAGALGRAICARLAEVGCRVAVCDNQAEAAAELARQLGPHAHAWSADVGQPGEVARLFAELGASFGAPAILVHCAGNPGRFAPLVELTDADWQATRAVHLDGAFYCLRAAAPAMIATGCGRIVNIASIAGLHGTVGSGAYAAAKAGMIGLTLTAAKELGPHGITVNCVAPGMIATPINQELEARQSGFITSTLGQTPTRAMSTPQDIAELVAYLVSDAARNLTGQVIAHDGGAGISMATDEYMRTQTHRRKGT